MNSVRDLTVRRRYVPQTAVILPDVADGDFMVSRRALGAATFGVSRQAIFGRASRQFCRGRSGATLWAQRAHWNRDHARLRPCSLETRAEIPPGTSTGGASAPVVSVSSALIAMGLGRVRRRMRPRQCLGEL